MTRPAKQPPATELSGISPSLLDAGQQPAAAASEPATASSNVAESTTAKKPGGDRATTDTMPRRKADPKRLTPEPPLTQEQAALRQRLNKAPIPLEPNDRFFVVLKGSPELIQEARRAYSTDFYDFHGPADTFSRWVSQALIDYATLPVDKRVEQFAHDLEKIEQAYGTTAVVTRKFWVSETARHAADAALAEERRAGLEVVMYEFVARALAHSINTTKAVSPKLREVTRRLPNQLTR